MAMSSKLLIASPLAVVLLSGCLANMNQNPISPDPAFGESAKYNAAVQTINPDPVYAEGSSQPGDSGAKGAVAVKRYRTDAVKQVEAYQTTSGGASGPR
jgi:hypothetical protein